MGNRRYEVIAQVTLSVSARSAQEAIEYAADDLELMRSGPADYVYDVQVDRVSMQARIEDGEADLVDLAERREEEARYRPGSHAMRLAAEAEREEQRRAKVDPE